MAKSKEDRVGCVTLEAFLLLKATSYNCIFLDECTLISFEDSFLINKFDFKRIEAYGDSAQIAYQDMSKQGGIRNEYNVSEMCLE